MKVIFVRCFGILAVTGTVLAFLWFACIHPEIIGNLKQAGPWTLLTVVLMYIGSVCSLAFVLQAMLYLYGKGLPYSELFLLTAYSSFANFFGPGQSGPGVRAVYLNVKHDLPFNQFLFGTSLYFAWLILFSGAMLVAPGTGVPWWLVYAYISMATALFALLIWLVAGPNKITLVPQKCKPRLIRAVFMTGVGTALQIAFVCAAYFTELCAVDISITISQAISFTGAANFSLFVSITPGAIGIREAFLFLSQSIHSVRSETIAAAGALDRAAYFVVLALLGLLVLFTHAGRRFRQPDEIKSQGNL